VSGRQEAGGGVGRRRGQTRRSDGAVAQRRSAATDIDGRRPAKSSATRTEGSASSPDQATPFHGSVGFTLSSTGFRVSRRFKEILAALELEPREFAILRSIGADEGRSQQASGERLGIAPSRMVAFVDELQARGLLERRSKPEDRRARALYLTARGRRVLSRAFARAQAFERELCADMGERERERLLAQLKRIGERVGLASGVHSAWEEADPRREG
jgi:DNA-binding MarR family transcriptional regulator